MSKNVIYTNIMFFNKKYPIIFTIIKKCLSQIHAHLTCFINNWIKHVLFYNFFSNKKVKQIICKVVMLTDNLKNADNVQKNNHHTFSITQCKVCNEAAW